MRNAEAMTTEETLTNQLGQSGNFKNKLLKKLQQEGHSLIYSKNQCSCVMNNGANDYGVVVLVKTKPGFSIKHDRLEHGIDQRHLEWLTDKVPYIQVWIFEKQSRKLLMAYYHKLSGHVHVVKGFPVEYVPRGEFHDVSGYLRGELPLSQLPAPEA